MTAQGMIFGIFAIVACRSAAAVVISQNVVGMAFWLFRSLGSTAALFLLMGADFVAKAQLLVYVGGTLVLLIFGVMLTASGPFMTMKTSVGEATLAAGVAFLLLSLLLTSACVVDWSAVAQAASRPEPFDPEQASKSG